MTGSGRRRLKPMRIRPVSPDSASPDVKRIFDAMTASGTVVSPFIGMLAHKPTVLRAYNQLSGALWGADSKLPEKLKDLAYLRASILNGCEY
jgi:alkylhydroperoxidase family enzyme